MTSLKPAAFSFGSSLPTPSRSSTSPALEQYPTSRIKVPSRSRKIAFSTPRSRLFISLVKAFQQLIRRERCRAQLLDHHAARVIGDLGGFDRRGAGGQCQSEQPDCRVACTR